MRVVRKRPDKIARDRVAHLVQHCGERRLIDLLAIAWLQGLRDAKDVLTRSPADSPRGMIEREGEIHYEVWQKDAFGDGDAMVAGSTSLNEAQHYAAVYGQDGTAWVVEVTRRQLPSTSTDGGR